jgi:hypothetical protein
MREAIVHNVVDIDIKVSYTKIDYDNHVSGQSLGLTWKGFQGLSRGGEGK